MVTSATKWRNRLISLAVLLVVWEVAGRTVESLLLPTFGETVAALARLLTTSELWHAFWLSNQALLIGYPSALLVGIPLGILMGSVRWLGRVLGVYLGILLMTPTAAIIPLIIIALGLTLTSRVMVVFLFAVPFITLNAQAGLHDVDRSLVEMARSFCATRWQILWKAVLPAAAPAMLLGARVGLARAVTGMVMVELLLVAVGLGRLLVNSQANFLAGDVYAVVLVILSEALLLMKLTRWLEHRLAPWVAVP